MSRGINSTSMYVCVYVYTFREEKYEHEYEQDGRRHRRPFDIFFMLTLYLRLPLSLSPSLSLPRSLEQFSFVVVHFFRWNQRFIYRITNVFTVIDRHLTLKKKKKKETNSSFEWFRLKCKENR